MLVNTVADAGWQGWGGEGTDIKNIFASPLI